LKEKLRKKVKEEFGKKKDIDKQTKNMKIFCDKRAKKMSSNLL